MSFRDHDPTNSYYGYLPSVAEAHLLSWKSLISIYLIDFVSVHALRVLRIPRIYS